jgi:hypothetical protein
MSGAIRQASLCGAAATRFDFHQTPCAPVIPGAGRPRSRRKSGSHRTRRLEEDGFELAVPSRRERLWAATPGKHCRFGPEPVGGSAFRAAVSDWQRPEEPFAGAGPMVRIRFPPAASPLRTDFSRGGSRTASRIWHHIDPHMQRIDRSHGHQRLAVLARKRRRDSYRPHRRPPRGCPDPFRGLMAIGQTLVNHRRPNAP